MAPGVFGATRVVRYMIDGSTFSISLVFTHLRGFPITKNWPFQHIPSHHPLDITSRPAILAPCLHSHQPSRSSHHSASIRSVRPASAKAYLNPSHSHRRLARSAWRPSGSLCDALLHWRRQPSNPMRLLENIVCTVLVVLNLVSIALIIFIRVRGR